MRSIFTKKSQTQDTSSPYDVTMTTTITRLISKREWQQLEDALATDPHLPIDDPTVPHAVTQDIVIHFAVRFQSPLRTVLLLSRHFPSSLEQSDATGRYPIHVAAKWGAMPDVIEFLIRTNPAAAGVQDDLGKTPMHYVAEYYTRNYNRRIASVCPVNESMLLVVKLLKNAAPKSVNLEDHDGVNAIEYALESDADIKVVKTMQRACRDDWREMKLQGQGKKHEELVRDVERIAMELQKNVQSRRNLADNDEMKSSEDVRIHFHRSTVKATTHAARTA